MKGLFFKVFGDEVGFKGVVKEEDESSFVSGVIVSTIVVWVRWVWVHVALFLIYICIHTCIFIFICNCIESASTVFSLVPSPPFLLVVVDITV